MLLGWHQTIMWTGLAMVGLHGTALALDPVMRFGFIGVLVPGPAPWRPLPVAAGIVTGWLMLDPRGLLPRPPAHRPAPLAPDALRQLRRLRDRALPRPQRRHRSHRGARPDLRRNRRRSGRLARLRPHPAAARRSAEGASPDRPSCALYQRAGVAPKTAGPWCRHDKPMQRQSFRAMGTICEVAATAGPPDVFLARRALEAASGRGGSVRACPFSLRCGQRPVAAQPRRRRMGCRRRATPRGARSRASRPHGHGRALRPDDPSRHSQAAGYDRSFELLTDREAVVGRRVACGRAHRRRPELGPG